MSGILALPATATARTIISCRRWFSVCQNSAAKAIIPRRTRTLASLSSVGHQQQQLSPNPNVVDILEQRGLVESITSDNLRSASSNSPLKVYCGFDPTAESLHLGNLIAIVVLSWFQRCGHTPVAVIGGATACVGDPSGKSAESPELDAVTLEKNTQGIHSVLASILGRFGDDGSFVILNNHDWWKDVSFLDLLKHVERYARVGSMMSKESVQKRLESEQGMSFTEFSYQLLQGYDFVHLYKNEGISVQIGGSDQWGNITAGTDLIRKVLGAEEGAYGLTFPLLLKNDGTKFGKSEEGTCGLAVPCIAVALQVLSVLLHGARL